MKRYSKRVVEEACNLLSAWASNHDPDGRTCAPMTGCAESMCGHLGDAHLLAMRAWRRAYEAEPFRDGAEQDAEAESLLRSGWRPS